MGPLPHETLVAGQQAEVRRAASLDPEELIASCRWLPLTG
jgi:hypothetical protein